MAHYLYLHQEQLQENNYYSTVTNPISDLSDRELERFIFENAAARWFCQFDLTAKTPDHFVFGRVRSRIGTANIDSKGFKHVAPSQGAVYADKGYCDKNTKQTAQIKNIHFAPAKKNNMKNKNRDLDSYYTKLRAPFEHVFSKQNKKVRYKGIVKN